MAHLDSLGVDAMKDLSPSLTRIEAILDLLDHPERAAPSIHITGTNGKTSVARIATATLAATGLRVATYTSPHLQTVRERISLDGIPVTEEVFGDVYDHILPYAEVVEAKVGERLSYFELLTAMFFLWAADAANVFVVEVGLGGRWDATNVIASDVAVVTNIAIDHAALLGSDRETIAKEKAGIIKPSSAVVTAELDPAILSIIKSEAGASGAPVSVLEQDFRVLENRTAVGGRYLSLRSSRRDYEGIFLPLHGSHQGINAAVALEAVTALLPQETIEDDVVEEGFGAVVVPGRLENIQPEDDSAPHVVLDVAHNPEGMSSLVTSLLEEFAFDSVAFVVGILEDKDLGGMLAELTRIDCRVVATTASSARSADPKVLQAIAEELRLDCEVRDGLQDAITSVLRESSPGELVVVTGSHYVVGEARTLLLG